MSGRLRRSDRVELLGKVSLFARCTKKELDRIAGITTPVSVGEGRVLAREGDTGQEFFVIVNGHASATVSGAEVGVLGPGSFFGEMALLDGGPRVATVTATSAMDLLVLTQSEFDSLLETTIPSVARRMLTELGGRLRMADAELSGRRATPVSGL